MMLSVSFWDLIHHPSPLYTSDRPRRVGVCESAFWREFAVFRLLTVAGPYCSRVSSPPRVFLPSLWQDGRDNLLTAGAVPVGGCGVYYVGQDGTKSLVYTVFGTRNESQMKTSLPD